MAQTISCLHCRKDFEPPRSDSKYCSRRCYDVVKYRRSYRYVNGVRHARSESLRAAVSPTTSDLAWAAGFLEGEGNFGLNHRRLGKKASQVVRATQKNLEPLLKLQRFLGGSVKPLRADGYAEWRTYGVRARGIMQTLYSFLSAKKRSDIRFALAGGF